MATGKLSILILRGFFAFLPFAQAQDKNVYKCADPDGIVYRDTPCATKQEQTLITSARKVNWQTGSAKGRDAPGATLATYPLSATRIHIGMIDTQVLNLAGWGRLRALFAAKPGTRGASSGSTKTGARVRSCVSSISRMPD